MNRLKFRTLYPWALVGVLFLLGCGAEKTDSSSQSTPPADTVGITPEPDTADPEPASALRVVVLGNSLAAGFGVDPEQAFPALIQQKIDSLGWNVVVQNAGVSGETTAGGLRRIDWLLRDRIDVLILELGGNDGLRGTPTEVTKSNLQVIIDATKTTYPDAHIVLAGMQVPTNLGPTYTENFRRLFPDLAEENDATLIPFLLEGVGGIPRLNQPDGIHPTAEGHRIVADNVWSVLKPVLESLQEPVV